jgi:hypothetical protein
MNLEYGTPYFNMKIDRCRTRVLTHPHQIGAEAQSFSVYGRHRPAKHPKVAVTQDPVALCGTALDTDNMRNVISYPRPEKLLNAEVSLAQNGIVLLAQGTEMELQRYWEDWSQSSSSSRDFVYGTVKTGPHAGTSCWIYVLRIGVPSGNAWETVHIGASFPENSLWLPREAF